MSRGESIYKLRLDSYLHEHFSSPMLKDVSIAFSTNYQFILTWAEK